MEYGVFMAVAKPWTVLDLEISGGRWQRKKKIDTPERGEEEQSEASTYEKYAMTILFYYFLFLTSTDCHLYVRSEMHQRAWRYILVNNISLLAHINEFECRV